MIPHYFPTTISNPTFPFIDLKSKNCHFKNPQKSSHLFFYIYYLLHDQKSNFHAVGKKIYRLRRDSLVQLALYYLFSNCHNFHFSTHIFIKHVKISKIMRRTSYVLFFQTATLTHGIDWSRPSLSLTHPPPTSNITFQRAAAQSLTVQWADRSAGYCCVLRSQLMLTGWGRQTKQRGKGAAPRAFPISFFERSTVISSLIGVFAEQCIPHSKWWVFLAHCLRPHPVFTIIPLFLSTVISLCCE